MPASLLTSRPVTAEPSARLHASRALRRAENDHDALRSLAEVAGDIAQLVQRNAAEVERLHAYRRQLDVLQSARGQELGTLELERAVQAAEDNGHALSEELASVRDALGDMQLSGGSAAQRDALAGQVNGDHDDVQAGLQELAALREGAGLRTPAERGRDAAQRGESRRQDTLEASAQAEVVRAEARQSDAAAGHRQPPMQLLPELESFVREWNTIAQDPRGVGQPGSDAAPTDNRVAALQGRWASWNLRTRAPRSMDPAEMTQWIMRQAYADNTLDMRAYAMRLEYYTNLKAHLREELNRARIHRSDHAPKPGEKTMTQALVKKQVSLEPNVDEEGNWHLREPQDGDTIEGADAMQDYIRELEQAMQTAGDDTQMAHIELQAMTQRQQQMLNTLSSLSKAQHETSMAILRKIGT